MIKRYLMREISSYGDFAFRVERTRLKGDFVFHDHDFHEIMVVVRGTAAHRVNDEVHPVRAGDVCVLSDGDRHGFEDVRGLELYNVMYDRSRLFSLGEDLRGLPGFQSLFVLDRLQVREHGYRSRVRLDPSQLAETEALLSRMLDEYARARGGMKTLLMASFILLIGHLSRCYVNNQAGSPGRVDRLAGAAACLRDPMAVDVNIDRLAGIAQMSRRHFQRTFMEAYGVSPTEYRIQVQMERACLLLRDPTLSVAEIASACGVSDSNYFSRLFRQHLGMTPVAYREKMRNPTP